MAFPEPTKNTWLRSSHVGVNYGGNTTMWIGTGYSHSTEYLMNIVLEFDFSASTYADVTAITQADLKLYHVYSTGVVPDTVTISRLGINFEADNPDGCNWTDTGTTTGSDPVGNVPWEGGTLFKMTDIPQKTFIINSALVDEDIVVDVLDFVRDGILRRGGIVRLLLSVDSSGLTANNYTRFGTTHATGDHPAINIAIASRRVWNGASGDGNAQTAGNYVGGVAPDADDFVMFTSGDVDVTSGSLLCHSLFIGKEYTGQIGTAASSIPIYSAIADVGKVRRVINKEKGKFFLINSTVVAEKVYIDNAPDGSLYKNTVDEFDVFVTGVRGTMTIEGDCNLTTTGSRSKVIEISDNEGSIVVVDRCRLTIADGCKGIVVVGRGVGVKVDDLVLGLSDSEIVIAGGGKIQMKGTAIEGAVHIYNGKLYFKDNGNGVITSNTDFIYIWEDGVLDTRTGTTSVNIGSKAVFRGSGDFMVDAGRTVAIA